jgi:hemolysin D
MMLMSLPYKKQQEHEFLPASLEIQEAPPSPTGRIITWTIMLFFVSAAAWAAIGNVDIVAVARGRVITSGHTKLIQPLEIGTIQNIHVTEGQSVQAGDVLIELKPDAVNADKKRIDEELNATDQEILRLKTIAGWVKQNQPDVRDLSNELSNLQKNLTISQWAEYESRLHALHKGKNKNIAEKSSLAQQVKKMELILPIVTRRAEKMKGLSKDKYLSEEQYLEVEQQRIEVKYDLGANQQRMHEIQSSIEEVDMQIQQVKKEFESRILLELQEAEKRKQALTQEKIKATMRQEAHILRAPVSGVVQQLAVHTIGGVVNPAQELMVIVPGENSLEVEAMIENRDIGFVSEGQMAEVKIDAFPFTKYGVIDATINNISNDAVADVEKGLVYKTQVALEKSAIKVEEKMVNLSPGMTVAVEIKTGKRRLIEYFLSPLLRYRQESVRER